jgi:hypothetical protein
MSGPISERISALQIYDGGILGVPREMRVSPVLTAVNNLWNTWLRRMAKPMGDKSI